MGYNRKKPGLLRTPAILGCFYVMLSSLDDSAQHETPRLQRELEWLTSVPATAAQSIRSALDTSPDPQSAVRHLTKFRRTAPFEFQQILESAAALRYLITVFSYSRFLSEAVIQHPEWVLECARSGDMYAVLTREQYSERLDEFCAADPASSVALSLARFRRRELLRIVLRDVLELGTLSDITEELSDLADSILDFAYCRVREDLSRKLATPSNASFSVIALGKLGGRELNYSSDVDLMFISGPHGDKEFLKQVANQYTALLSTYTAEGMCYRVDLRLRPDGRYGEICHSLPGAEAYYRQRARDWELQMLIKARVCAGDAEPGQALLQFVEPLIYSTTLDFHAVEAVAESRERISERLRHSTQQGTDIKLARGGIRDIEFLVQCMQRLHGGREPWVRHGGTLLALFRLRDKDLISDREYARLLSAYLFLRNLEHRLQFDEDRQTHTLPVSPAARELLARKMPGSRALDAPRLEVELTHHLEAVQELYERIIHTQRATEMVSDGLAAARAEQSSFPSANLSRLLDSQAPQFARALTALDASRSGPRMEHLLEKLVAQPEWLAYLEARPQVARCMIDLFDHSQYFSDQLTRHPSLLAEVGEACSERQGRTGFDPPADAAELRRFFRKQIVRIQSDSVHHSVDVFRTLRRTSLLADSVIRTAYEIALSEAGAANRPHHMMVIALGRLGMLEFDLASDADLAFALPDTEAHDLIFWTGIAERMIHVISAYTGDGVIFSVDTRLRPNGRSGPLVQSAGVFRDYFARSAEAWEGISYLKARAVAGDIDKTTAFLGELQEIDWRRYGQSGRSRKELADMRARLEREQGARNPLKAAPGGYYDIDFALLYLRLRGAGLFFPVLNTPKRIDVVEKMGHLEREDADFLREAAGFYRALEHGLRIATGHAEGSLPTSPAQLAVLTELVNRWTPEHLREGSLESRLCVYRTGTRRFYDRLFA